MNNLKCAKTVKDNPFASGKSSKGTNPFDTFTIGGKDMSSIVKCYNPNSASPYTDIKDNIDSWIETAIQIRTKYGS